MNIEDSRTEKLAWQQGYEAGKKDAEKEVTRLRAVANEYADHLPGCVAIIIADGECTCGFERALAAAAGAEESKRSHNDERIRALVKEEQSNG
jgi:hypothetical protein